MKEAEAHLPTLFEKLDLTGVIDSLSPALRAPFIKSVNGLGVKVPLGSIKREGGEVVITSFENADSKPLRLKETARPILCGPETSIQDFMKQALGETPRVVICPVGWTIPSPEVLINNNPTFKAKADELRAALTPATGATADSDKLVQKGLKKLAGAAYEEAFKKFWDPIDKYLFEERGLDPKKFAFLTSASYDGIDKAAMDYADGKNIDVVNVTPFTYAGWMNTDKSYPLLVTNSIDDYADSCAKGAGVLFVTGGRAHAWQKDVKNFLIDNKKFVIPVDIMHESLGLDVPATLNGQVDNAARMLKEMGLDISNAKLAKNVRNNGQLTDEQKYVAGAIETLYNQITFADPNAIAKSLKK